jgi:hypothetical protein
VLIGYLTNLVPAIRCRYSVLEEPLGVIKSEHQSALVIRCDILLATSFINESNWAVPRTFDEIHSDFTLLSKSDVLEGVLVPTWETRGRKIAYYEAS